MSLTPAQTLEILRQTVFLTQAGMDATAQAEQTQLYQRCCGNLRPDIFEAACIRAVRANKSDRWLKPGHVYAQAMQIQSERNVENSGQVKVQPQTPEEVKTFCLLEVKKMSPHACKKLVNEIDNGAGLTKYANWDSEVLTALALKAAEYAPEPEKPKPFKKAVDRAVQVALPKQEPTGEIEVPFQ
jgi:hypothetical protein